MIESLFSLKYLRYFAGIILIVGISLVVSHVHANGVSYTYDERDRVIQEVYENGSIINYSYDDAGNRISKEVLKSGNGITLIMPNGGEHWQPGSIETIYWTYKEGVGPFVAIELWKGGVLNRVISSETSIGNSGGGSYDWHIPGMQAQGADYRIRIISISNSTHVDASRGSFTIAAIGFNITSPNGNDPYERGKSYPIKWTYAEGSGTSVRIDLLNAGVFKSNIMAAAPIGSGGTGSYLWTIPASQKPANGYQIRVSHPAGTPKALSSPFIIIGGITITSPKGGEKWYAGTTRTIGWKYTTSAGSSVNIELLKGGVVQSVIDSGVPIGADGKGTFNWPISESVQSGSDYKIRITSASNSAYTDTSDGNFTILPSSITVTVPNGGQAWQAGDTKAINWSYKGQPGASVKIDLLKGGTLHHTLTSSTPVGNSGKGSFNWPISASQTPGSDFKVRITSATNSSYTDDSDQNFTVIPISLTVKSPNGGENWQAGTNATIRWTYDGNPGNSVKIELLKDDVTEQVITGGAPIGTGGIGAFTWPVPPDHAFGDHYKIRITSASNSAYTDTSDGNFTILPSSITVTVPNGGQAWQAGDTKAINWSYKGQPGASVKINFLHMR